MNRPILALAIAGLLCAGAASAAQFDVIVAAHPDAVIGASAVDVTSPDLEVVKLGASTWRVAFRNPDDFQAHLKIAMTDVPEGYDPYAMEFDIPYDWDQARMAVAVAGDSVYLPGAVAFARDIHAVPGDPARLVLVNQRARRIFQARYRRFEQGEHPQRADVNVAYWLLLTSDALILNSRMQVDPTTSKAMDWMWNLALDPHGGGLLGSATVPAADVKTVVLRLRQRDAIVYNRLVRQIADDLKSKRGAELALTCDRARRLHRFFTTMSADRRKSLDGEFGNAMHAAENAATCTARRLTALQASGTPLSPADVADAQSIVADANQLVREAEAEGVLRSARRLAAARATDLGMAAQF